MRRKGPRYLNAKVYAESLSWQLIMENPLQQVRAVKIILRQAAKVLGCELRVHSLFQLVSKEGLHFKNRFLHTKTAQSDASVS